MYNSVIFVRSANFIFNGFLYDNVQININIKIFFNN